ncbi:HD domain-containing protein [Candidatus Woesearchaeota archaeon]|nr:HD domain-containing protein [Candidatus Woesearchaeota archaeon]
MNAQDVILTYSKIYETINIFPFIQLHQLRVAKVAKLISGMVTKETNVNNIVAAGLLHDMGNIVKINFDSPLAKESLRFDEHGVDYWNGIKEEHIKEYGEWSHTATENILKKLEIEKPVVDLINLASWQHIQEVIDGDDWNAKILAYADYRVMPHGVSSLSDRLDDLKKRYHTDDKEAEEEAKKVHDSYFKLEEQLVKFGLKPDEITDESITFIEI